MPSSLHLIAVYADSMTLTFDFTTVCLRSQPL